MPVTWFDRIRAALGMGWQAIDFDHPFILQYNKYTGANRTVVRGHALRALRPDMEPRWWREGIYNACG